jgi:DnaJ-class molecular chaperone
VEDKQGCDSTIEPGTSGYCKCSDGREVRKETCDHPRFTCEDACVEPPEFYQCKGWRETAECNSEGPRIEAEDKPCNAMVPGDRSGYCECSDERRVLINGCWLSRVAAVPQFRCQDVCAAGPSYYEILGLDASGDDKAVQRNFRKLSLKHHPDKNKAPGTAARYRSIRAAYDVLGDPEKKVLYRLGGGQLVGKKESGRGVETSPTNSIEIQVGMSELYTGHEFQQGVRRKIICRDCRNSNAPHCRPCNQECAHEKQLVNVRMGPMVFQQEQNVPSQEKCRFVDEMLPILLEPGTRDGTELTFTAMGEQFPNMLPGDLKVKIKQKEHPNFKRQVDTLLTRLDLSLKEMLLGFSRQIPHLDGHLVTLEVQGPIAVNSVLRVKEEGMPKPTDQTQKGELVVNLNLMMPTELNDEQYQAIENLF